MLFTVKIMVNWRKNMRRGENIYKRKDGRWEGRYISSRDENGKSKYTSVYAKSYSEVKEKMQNIESYIIPKNKKNQNLFKDVADSWFMTVKMKNRISTYTTYQSIYQNHIMPIIGNLRIDLLEPHHIDKLLELYSGLSAKSKNDILSVIRSILKYGESIGISTNKTIMKLSVHQENSPVRVLTSYERENLNEYLLNDRNSFKTGVYFALHTGVRIGEVCGLQRKDFDFDNAVVHINSTVQRVKNFENMKNTIVMTSEPKSASSIRDIPLSDYLVRNIKDEIEKLLPDDYILTENQNMMEPRLFRYHFKKYIKECDIADIRFHTLRHDFATRCIEKGMDVKTLSEILGHSDVNVTLRRYVHSSMELKRKNIEKLTENN